MRGRTVKSIIAVFVAMLAVGLSACASTPNVLAKPVRESMFIKTVEVGWSLDDSKVQDASGEYAKGKNDLIARLGPAVQKEFATSPSGSEAATMKIDIKRYSRVGAAMGNLIGGANAFAADVSLMRQGDNVLIGIYPDVRGFHASNGGIIGLIAQSVAAPDIVGIMVASFQAEMRAAFDNPTEPAARK